MAQYEDKDFDKTIEDVPVVPVVNSNLVNTAGLKTQAVANAELYAAIQDSKIQPLSKRAFKLYFSIFVAFCCCIANGYDGSLMTSILAMPHFRATFGAGTKPINTSLIFSIYTAGAMVGASPGAFISDRYGRRQGMAVGAVVIILGMVIASTGHTLGTLVGGRFVLGLGVSVMTVAAPSYAAEIAPPQWRGRVAGLYNCGYFGGAIPAGIITYGTNYIDSDWSWRIPLILQAFACILVLIFLPFVPESPRFMMMNNRHEQALEFLVEYHGNGDPHNRLVAFEYAEWQDGISSDGSDKVWWDYRALWATHASRWRLAQVAMISIFPAFSNGGLGYYNTLIYANLGITSPPQQLLYNMASTILSGGCAIIGASLTDWMPRRKVIVTGTFLCACSLATNAGLSAKIAKQLASESKYVTPALAKGGLAALFIFGVFFSFFVTPLQIVIPTEALETTTRAKGLAFSGFSLNALGFINQFAAPLGLNKLGYKYIWIWVGCGFVESAAWYFFCVESKGRTLEELAWIYDQPNPVKASKKKEVVLLQEDGRVSEKIIE